MEDIIGIATLYTFITIGVALPLYVIAQSIINLARAIDGRGTIVLKALVVLVFWVILTAIFIAIPLMYVFEPGRGVDAATANRRITIMTIMFTLIYLAVGLALSYWVRQQPGWKTMGKIKSEV
jgi:hypothetical protein